MQTQEKIIFEISIKLQNMQYNFYFTLGFGMLESGIVSLKNEVNIMMKNVVDVVLGGLTYWAFGYSLSYGESSYSNPFISFGSYFVGEDTVIL